MPTRRRPGWCFVFDGDSDGDGLVMAMAMVTTTTTTTCVHRGSAWHRISLAKSGDSWHEHGRGAVSPETPSRLLETLHLPSPSPPHECVGVAAKQHAGFFSYMFQCSRMCLDLY